MTAKTTLWADTGQRRPAPPSHCARCVIRAAPAAALSSTPHPSRSACLLLLLGRDVELEEDDVAVLDDVLLALGLILARLHQVRGVRVSLRVGLKGRGSG